MNVVILTPDSVGSTLLQRVLTVQMMLSDFDKPVVNLHELTNGIDSFYSPELQTMVLGKYQSASSIGYSQSLSKIIDLLESHDHYKTSRLAYYHIQRRKDDYGEQRKFYEYLNEHFFIISARRKNLLDYGLSWCLRNITKKLNVYSPAEKIIAFIDLFKDPIKVDTEVLINHLQEYKDYIQWANQNFDIGSHYYYETYVHDLENYMLSLPIFANREKKKWQDVYDISFNDFNKCHKSISDIGAIALEKNNEIKLLSFDNTPKKDLGQAIFSHLPTSTQDFITLHKNNYDKAHNSINHLVKLGILASHVPIKKLTFAEKKFIVKNFNECVDVFNNWIINYPDLGEPITDNSLALEFTKDNSMWTTKE